MEQIARTVYLPKKLNDRLVGMSLMEDLDESTILCECVELAFNTHPAAAQLSLRLYAIKTKEKTGS